MQLENYAADTICRAMGLAGFIEPDWSPPVLRLLLKPSFDPEVCITLSGPAERARLSVIALAESFWQRLVPCRLAEWSEQRDVDRSAFEQILANFDEAIAADRDPHGRIVLYLDGMPVECCLVTNEGQERFACHPYRPAVSTFVARLLRLAWESCSDAGVRNALAACAHYLGERYPREPQPPVPEIKRMLVLGTPEARADFLRQWREHKGSA